MAKKEKTKKKNPVLPALAITLAGILALVVLVLAGRVLKLRKDAKELVAGVTKETFRQTETSIIYDSDGNEITKISGIKELYYLESDEIPEILKAAFVQIEDQDFYEHNGIDASAILRAVIANVKSDSIAQGASTITQQLAKNMFLSSEVTWNRKITEMFVAFELENKFSKDQILEFYINNIYYGNGYYGIEAAAQGYFGKTTGELNLSEIAFLAGIPNNPNKYDPISNYENAVSRRDSVLRQLYAAGLISSLDYYEAAEYEIAIVTDEEHRFNSVETYVFYCATRALMAENGFVFRYEFEDEEDQAAYEELYDSYYKDYQQSLFTGGYRIYTSIDMTKQELLQETLDQNLASFTDVNDEGIYRMQGAAVCIDNSTGLVVAIVGGREQDYDGYTLNRAYQSYRQPGSAIKPVLVYAPYMELGHNPEEIVDDSPIPTGPNNFNDTYRGLITIREALGCSSNVVAYKLLGEMTPSYGMSFLHAMNFKKIAVDDDEQITAIGGFTYGVSPVELASAYATLANDGEYREPTCIDHISDSQGNLIVGEPTDSTAVYSTESARMVTKSMEWALNDGPLRYAALENAYAAGKSGTTTDNKDGWFAGYTRYYTTVVWCGMDMPQSVEDLTGSSYPLNIWKEFMNAIHEDLTVLDFPSYTSQDEYETSDSTENGGEDASTERPGWHGGGELNIDDGDTGHDVDVSGMGDQDAP